MPLVFLPDAEALFLWGTDRLQPSLSPVLARGRAASARLLTPDGLVDVAGAQLSLLDAAQAMVVTPAAELDTLPGSVAIWTIASKLAIELVSREHVVPTITRQKGRIQARWAAALAGGEDGARVAALAKSMPPAAHAVPVVGGGARDVWSPDALLRAYLDAVVDSMVRAARGGPELPSQKQLSWDERWSKALRGPERDFDARGFAERGVVDSLVGWSEPALGARDRLRACFRLELPVDDGEVFRLRFFLQSPDDPSLLISATEVWTTAARSLEVLGRAFRDPQESLLGALARASRLFPPMGTSLDQARPESLDLDPATAWSFLAEGAAALSDSGFGVIVPGELTTAGQRRLRLRMRVGGSKSKVAGVVSGAARIGMDELLTVDWEAVIGDQALTSAELTALANRKAPLVRHRGEWVAIDSHDLGEIKRHMAGGPTTMTAREAVQAALAGEANVGELSVGVLATGSFKTMLDQLRQSGSVDMRAPATLRATLRPYQERGLHWLSTMSSLGRRARPPRRTRGATRRLQGHRGCRALLFRLSRQPRNGVGVTRSR